MLDLCDNIEGKSFCPLGDAAAWPIQSAIKRFPEDFIHRLQRSNVD
jgi:NADH-quinone oxidoreductase subunit F